MLVRTGLLFILQQVRMLLSLMTLSLMCANFPLFSWKYGPLTALTTGNAP